MIKNILFDMGGVIFLQNTEKAFRRFTAQGVDTNVYMGAHGQKGIFLDLEEGKITPEEFRRGMSKIVGHEVSMEDVAYCWEGFFDGAPVDRLHTLLDLKKHYHLGLLSNTNPFMMALTDSSRLSTDRRPISDYFDSLFLSYEMKAYKPDEKIFRMVLERDGLLAEETLFIDDALKNIEGARRLGIHGLHVTTNADWRPQLFEIISPLRSGR
jgi:HAD hydrolase, family IA, variant 3